MSEHRSEHGRELLLAVVGCAVAAGLLLTTSGLAWLHVSLAMPPPLPAVRETLTGAEVVEPLVPIGIVVGAAGLALVATRRLGRPVVACVLVLAGLLVAGVVGFFLYDDASLAASNWAQSRAAAGESPFPDREVATAPAVGAILGAGIAVAVGLFAIRRSKRWPVMGARYERRTPRADDIGADASPPMEQSARAEQPTADEASMWSALERGEDPTMTTSEPGRRTTAKPPDQAASGP